MKEFLIPLGLSFITGTVLALLALLNDAGEIITATSPYKHFPTSKPSRGVSRIPAKTAL